MGSQVRPVGFFSNCATVVSIISRTVRLFPGPEHRWNTRPALKAEVNRCLSAAAAHSVGTKSIGFWCKFRTGTAVGHVYLVDQEWSAYATRAARQISGMVAVAPPSLPIWNGPCWIFSANSMPRITTAAVRKLFRPRIGPSRCFTRRGPVRWCGSGTYCFAPQRASATRRSFFPVGHRALGSGIGI